MKNTTYKVKKSDDLLKQAKEVIPGGIFGHYKLLLGILDLSFSLVPKEPIFGTLMIIST